jgi:anthraniloyl-CoA monooxygenase
MKIAINGGGPAGLFFAILMKKAEPRHDITVFERNGPDDTFGFGVVFSDETLSNFMGADEETFREITRAFAYWDDIEVRYRDVRIRARGHGFAGLGRQKLLNILQTRAEALGVNILYRMDITDMRPFEGAELVVGADGVNSFIRERFKDKFKPAIDMRKTKFVWLGTTKSFGPFTFIFKSNEHGWFYVHAYRYAEGQTTWIVETHEETWRRAGLDKASEAETVAYLEKLYAPELEGHRLLTNKSIWRSFPMVTNEAWHHGNIVLLGDAAHTVQFSIGSGTKVALEDAAALAEAFAHNRAVPDALAAYEESRRPEIGRLQASAYISLKWYENALRYNTMEPQQYVFSFMSRTKGVTYENLRLRDNEYVASVDRWWAGQVRRSQGFDVPIDKAPPPMFTPFRLRDMVLANRLVVSPMCQYSAQDGTPNDWHMVHLGGMAVGGAGLVYTEMTDVSREGRITPGCAGMYKDEHVAAWRRIVEFVHANSEAKICMQLAHAGQKGATKVAWEGPDEPLEAGAWPIISASATPWLKHSQVPKAMDRADMDKVRDDFARAARRADEAGFDMIELHMAHGYLLSSFITPLSNLRRDEYGGSLENRMRFPLEVLDAVRAAWPAGKPISVRISATDWVEGEGVDGDEAVEIARMLKAHGADIIDVSAGQTSLRAKPVYGRMFQTQLSEQVRLEAGVPTITVGNITTADQVNTIVAAGRADLVALARPHLTNSHFALEAAAHYGYAEQHWPNQYLTAKSQAMRLAAEKNRADTELREAAKARPVEELKNAAE